MEGSCVQPTKALSPICFTPLGTVTEISFPQSRKALLPMVSTPEGIVTEIREEL